MTCFEELLEQADQAMYEQKRMKRRRAECSAGRSRQPVIYP
jgi:PleD family two-component response regulator